MTDGMVQKRCGRGGIVRVVLGETRENSWVADLTMNIALKERVSRV